MAAYKGWYKREVEKMGQTRWLPAIARYVAPPLDRLLYRFTGGRILSTGPPVLPTLLLTVVGRKSGRERTVPLLYIRDGENLVVAATNWGQDHNPAWSENLLTNPRARVQIGECVSAYRARLAAPEEKDQLWPRLLKVWPAYDNYQERSGRDIRVFVLEPQRARE